MTRTEAGVVTRNKAVWFLFVVTGTEARETYQIINKYNQNYLFCYLYEFQH
jgi:hypothetical protein